MTARTARVGFALAAALLAAPARADTTLVCDGGQGQDRGLPEGPIRLGYFDADFATGQGACPRSHVGLLGRAQIALDRRGFYGSIAAGGLLSGSYAVRRDVEVSGALEFVRYQYVQNATIYPAGTSDTSLYLGQMTLGASYLIIERPAWALTPYGRLLLPTASLPHARTLGGEIGLSALYRPLRQLSVHGHVAGDLLATVSAAVREVQGGLALAAGLQYAPATWFGVAFDLHLHLFALDTLDYLTPALALRFRLYRGLGLELAGALTATGAAKLDGLLGLRLGYRF